MDIKLNLSAEPFSGQIVTFTAPCDCVSVTNGLSINGEIYTVCDAVGKCVTGIGGAWAKGSQVSVVLDCTAKKAYIQNNSNYAPAGYGLGAQAKAITDPDEATNGGIYRIYSQTDNMPFNFMLLLSMPYYDDWVQFATQWTTGVMAVRHHTASAGWSEWEYINSPMKTGVEYRTTERIDGKAVYKKNVSGAIQYRLEGETTWNS